MDANSYLESKTLLQAATRSFPPLLSKRRHVLLCQPQLKEESIISEVLKKTLLSEDLSPQEQDMQQALRRLAKEKRKDKKQKNQQNRETEKGAHIRRLFLCSCHETTTHILLTRSPLQQMAHSSADTPLSIQLVSNSGLTTPSFVSAEWFRIYVLWFRLVCFYAILLLQY